MEQTDAITMTMPTGIWLSDSDIIEEADQMKLIAARDDLREKYFLIGDIANKYIMGNAKSGIFLSAERVYQAVARFIGSRSPRTVRYYAEVAAFFSGERLEARKLYGVLPFSFFDYAKSVGERWEKVLGYAAEHPFMTLRDLENFFSDPRAQEMHVLVEDLPFFAPNEPPSFPVHESPTQGDLSAPQHRAQVVSKFALSMLVVTISDLLDRLERIVSQVGLPEEMAHVLAENAVSLRAVLPQIARYADKNSV